MYTEECIHFQILKHQFNWYRKRMEISQSSGKKRQNENIFVLLLFLRKFLENFENIGLVAGNEDMEILLSY